MSDLQRFRAPQPQVGDYTGRQQVIAQGQADERLAARERLIKDLSDPAVAFSYINVPGRGLVPVDRDAVTAIQKAAR